VLREFRDRVLLQSAPGSEAVAAYYEHGKAAAQTVAGSEALRFVVRVLLLPVIGAAQAILWLL